MIPRRSRTYREYEHGVMTLFWLALLIVGWLWARCESPSGRWVSDGVGLAPYRGGEVNPIEVQRERIGVMLKEQPAAQEHLRGAGELQNRCNVA